MSSINFKVPNGITEGLNQGSKNRPFEIIEQFAKERLDGFRSLIKPDGSYLSRIYESHRSISEEISHDYAGRFLIELIQNGYDAHPRSTSDGEIAVYLRTSEEKHGVLYVANRGNSFTASNVKAICDIGLSDKPVGETIGNKGLGFRSVQLISDEPEIYSKSEFSETDQFDGFCFRFANSADRKNMIEDEQHRELADRDLPPFHVPVSIEPPFQNPFLDSLGRQGFSTVIRLPFSSAFARETAIDSIDEIHRSDSPLLVFLPRLSKLMVDVEGDSSRCFSLLRSGTILEKLGSSSGDRLELADLSDLGRYFICWRDISEARVKSAIKESIERKQLHPTWKDWSGPGEVAVAVPIEQGAIKAQFYTFLPMGPQAQAPLAGLVHGAFYPKADRTSMDANVPLNDLYLREAVQVAASAIFQIRTNVDLVLDLDQSALELLVVDLMSWGEASGISGSTEIDFPRLMTESLTLLGAPAESTNLFPIVSVKNSERWATSIEISRWDSYADRSVININNIVESSGEHVLSPDLGEDRLARLERFLADSGLRDSLNPNPDVQARAIEAIAVRLHRDLTPRKRVRLWREFYLNLAELYEEIGASNWEQRHILLCDDDTLHSPTTRNTQLRRRRPSSKAAPISKSESAAVFVPPIRRRGGSLTIPAALSGYFAFLDPKLDWGNKLEPARKVLEDAGAVQPYDAEGIIASLSRIKVTPRNPVVSRAVLELVFKLWDESSGMDVLRRAYLEVPGIGRRWIKSTEAVFSKGWPEATLGNILHTLIDKAGAPAAELFDYKRRMIASPRTAPIDRWTEFFQELGVGRGLKPHRLEPKSSTIRGSSLSFDTLCDQLKIGPHGKDYILREVGSLPSFSYTGTSHRLPRSVPYIIGQEDFDTMDDECKDLFAQLILESLPEFGSGSLEMEEYSESFSFAGRTTWPSPALAFLRQAEWFPVDLPASQPTKIFTKPKNVLLGPDTGSRFPGYMNAPSRSLRKSLPNQEIREALKSRCDMGVFDDPGSRIIQTQLLAKAITQDSFPRSQFRSCELLYWETWRQAIRSTTPEEWDWLDDEKVLVYRSKGIPIPLSLFSSQIAETGLFIRDTPDGLTSRLLEELGYFVWNAGQDAAKQLGDYLVTLLGPLLGTKVHRTSEVDIQVLMDGQPINKVEGYRLIELVPSLPQVVSRCMAALRGPDAQRLSGDWRDVLNRVQRIEIKVGHKLEFSIEGEVLSLPSEFLGFLLIRDQENPTVLVENVELPLTWSSLRKARTGIADAINHIDLAPHLNIAFSAMERSGSDPEANSPSVQWDAVESDLQLNDDDLQKVIDVESGDHEWSLKFLRSLIIYSAGENVLEGFLEWSRDQDSEEIIRRAILIITQNGIDEKRLLSLLETVRNFEDVLDALELDLGRFNQALKVIGEIPLMYRDLHVDGLRSYINEEHDTIMMPIRLAHFSAFKTFGNLSDYVSQKNVLDNLEPDTDWLDSVRMPTTDLLEGVINDFKHSLKLPRQRTRIMLGPLSQIRDANNSQMRRLTTKTAPLVRAWCRKKKKDAGVWAFENIEDTLLGRLDAAGVLDFVQLSEKQAIQWFKTIGDWPDLMPTSASRKVLGLSEKDLSVEQHEAEDQKRELERERRSIQINGKILDSDDLSVPQLMAEFEQLVHDAVGLPNLSSGVIGKMPKPRLGGSTGGNGSGGGTIRRLTSQQSDLVGFLGELAVFHWLKRVLPGQNLEKAWVSKYCERVIPGSSGDDSRGYDFEVTYGGKKLFLEVKGHLNDPQSVELGETEVRQAQESVRLDLDYKIVYVSGLAGEGNFNIELLPNPFTLEGQRTYKLDGRGLRYKFVR